MFIALRTWLADHYRGAQYPKQEYLRRGETGTRPFWKHQMPWPQRLLILTVSITGLIICIPLLIVSGLVLYFVIQALFS